MKSSGQELRNRKKSLINYLKRFTTSCCLAMSCLADGDTWLRLFRLHKPQTNLNHALVFQNPVVTQTGGLM